VSGANSGSLKRMREAIPHPAIREGLSNWRQLNRLDLLALIAVTLIGATKLAVPFSADQAIFTIIAEGMRTGAAPYRDLWDVKQPGIFYFCLAGGSLFGFDEIGIHLFELLYMVVFAMVLLVTLKDLFANRGIASLIPLLTVGVYYAIAGDWHLTQPESVVGFPIFLSLWFAFKSLQPGRHQTLWLFMSGFMGGVVLVFKFIFGLILAGFWLTLVWRAVMKHEGDRVATLLKTALSVGFGALVPLLIMFAHLTYVGAIDSALWTFFQYPKSAVGEWPLLNHIDALINGVTWFIGNFAPLMALGTIGAYVSWRRRKDYLTLNVILWLPLGFLVILLQPLSWWQYHFMLLSVPVGLLGAWGLDVLWPKLKEVQISASSWQSAVVAGASLLVLFSPILTSAGMRSIELARNGFLNKADRLRYQSNFNNDYRVALQEVAFLSEPASLPGSIFVLGDPLFYYLSGRRPAVPFLNAAGFSPPDLWERLVKSFYHTRPAYVFLPKNKLGAIRKYTPRAAAYIDETARFIATNYDVSHTSDTGTWYVVRHIVSASQPTEASTNAR
jgi:hypothetical protein